MEPLASPCAAVSRKRQADDEASACLQSVSTSGASSTSHSGFGSPTIQKRPMTQAQHQQQQHLEQAAPMSQFPVLDYHMQQCYQSQGSLLNNTLQPADSSTWSNWQQLPTAQQLELLNQGDTHMADSQPQLTRANSAPELVKLTQADSAAWQQAHAASSGGANLPPTSALLSHKDFWVV